MHLQAAYNNTSEIELEGSDVRTVQEPSSSLYPIGTKIAKQFDGVNGELVWFGGVVQRFEEQEGLYWVLYSDGDSEDMDEFEVRDAVHDYKVHLQQQEDVAAEVESAAAGSMLLSNDVHADVHVATALKAADDAVPTAVPIAADSSHTRAPSELAVAVQAMTAAAERLASAATRIETAVQQPQHAQQFQHGHLCQQQWQHLQWQQQQQQQFLQQQQQVLHVCYQQQQLMYWQQQQQYFDNFKQLWRR
jgi:hypothetical protein